MATEKYPEEFEIVPLSPIRRLEKRIEQLESMGGIDSRQILRDIISIVRMNQQLVDELAKANDALRIEISKLPARLEELINSLNELLSYIKASAEELSELAETLRTSGIDMKSVEEMAAAAEELSATMEESNKASQEIMQAIEQISAAAKEQASATEESSKSSHYVRDNAVKAKQMSNETKQSLQKVENVIKE